jgi:hypothetical protein
MTPEKTITSVESFARKYTRGAVMVLVKIMKSKNMPPNIRVLAARAVLDRGWGAVASGPTTVVELDAPMRKVIHEIVEPIDRPDPTFMAVRLQRDITGVASGTNVVPLNGGEH